MRRSRPDPLSQPMVRPSRTHLAAALASECRTLKEVANDPRLDPLQRCDDRTRPPHGSSEPMATTTTGGVPLTQRPAWTALQKHYGEIKETHLRTLFADDPTRGERLTAEAVGLFLDLFQAPHHRRDAAPAAAAGRGVRPARAHRRDVPRREDQHHRRAAPCCTSRCAPRATPSIMVDGENVVPARPRRAGPDGRVRRPRSAAARGRATPASASATSSTSASAARTSGRSMAYEALRALQPTAT